MPTIRSTSFLRIQRKLAGHNVKPSLPGKMCNVTSVVQSQQAMGQTRKRICIPVYHVQVLVNTIRPSGLVGVFIQRAGFVFYGTLLWLVQHIYTSHGVCLFLQF